MKPQNRINGNSWVAALLSACAIALLLIVTAAAPAGVAYAGQGGTPGAPGNHDGQGGGQDGTPKAPPDQAGDKALGNFLQREQNVLNSLDHRLDVSAKVAARAQDWIDKQNAAGKDTTGLVAGLAAFNAQVAEAKSDRDQAAGLLAAHAGFDANGTLTDRKQALNTVREVRTLLRQANMALVKAVPDFRKAVNDFRQANKTQGGDGGKGKGQDGQGNQGQGNKGQGQGSQGQGAETSEPTEQPAG